MQPSADGKIPAPLTNGQTVLKEETLQGVADRLRGPLIRSGDDGYDEARTVWNGMIDKRPALIVRCAGTADVIDAVNFAREHDLRTAVKGGGHNATGNAVCEDGLVRFQSMQCHVNIEPTEGTRSDTGTPPPEGG